MCKPHSVVYPRIICLLVAVLNMKVCALFWSFCCVGVMAGKYSREVNEQKASNDGQNAVEFRVAKLNQVWEKANRVRGVFHYRNVY